MSVNMKRFIFFFLLFISNEYHCSILKIKQLKETQQQRNLDKKNDSQNLVKENCVKDCNKNNQENQNLKPQERQLQASNDFMQVIFVVLMVYLMFNQPFLTGLMLFFGGLGSMFRKMVKKERRLHNITPSEFNKLAYTNKNQYKQVFQKERQNLFRYLKKYPLKFKKLTKERLLSFTNKYFAKNYKKKDPLTKRHIQQAVKFVLAHKKMLTNYIKSFNTSN